jgi:16S rRNA (guanine966-N2)-methyltransferase
MRIISGQLSGRNFESVSGHRTHPMSEKIRGAIFNALGDVEGLSVLDAYAGTGALGFEALSRGASRVLALDTDKNAARTIKENIDRLGLSERMKVSRVFVKAWHRRNQNERFDLVLLDPPYDQVDPKDLIALGRHALPGGIVVLSLPPHDGFRYGESRFELLSEKNYGDANVLIYRSLG